MGQQRQDERLKQIEELARDIHRDDLDAQGRPYIEHLLAVAGAASAQNQAIALLHDSYEDHPERLSAIAAATTTDELAAILTLARKSGESYAEYIGRLKRCPGTLGERVRDVKIADLRHNLGRLTPELERLRARYGAALAELA